jgi:hypothetical protein
MKKIIAPIIVFVFLFIVPYLLPVVIRREFIGFSMFIEDMVSILGIGLLLFGVFWIEKVNKLFIKRDYELGSRGYPFIIVGFSIWFLGQNLVFSGNTNTMWWSYIYVLCAPSWLIFIYTKNFSDFASKDFVVEKRTNLYCLIGSLAVLFMIAFLL